MSESKIMKVKLLQDNEKLQVFYKKTNRDGSHSVIPGEERDSIPHQDLVNAMQKLAMHLALLCDYTNIRNSRNEETLKKFVVTGYSVFGKNDNGVIITGYKLTERGIVPLNTPKIWFNPDGENPYYFLDGLKAELEVIVEETFAFLNGSKKGVAKKQEQPPPDDDGVDTGADSDEDADDIDEPVARAPRKKSAKKSATKSKSK